MQTSKTGEPAAQWRTQPDHMIEKVAPRRSPCGAHSPTTSAACTPTTKCPHPRRLPRRGAPGQPDRPRRPAEPAESFETARPPQDVHLPPIPEDGVKATPAQLRHLHALFGDAGWGKEERGDRLAAAGNLIGSEIESFNDLTEQQAITAIRLIEELKKRSPDTALLRRLAPGDRRRQMRPPAGSGWGSPTPAGHQPQ